MASKYTYEDFTKAATAAGLMGNFSEADLRLAQSNPDAGMSILQYKQDYRNATTDEARALANLGAEGVRSSYGNYTGGNDGGGFYLDPLSPGSFNAGTAPTYTNNYAGDIAALYEQQKNYGGYDYGIPQPEYTNRYDATIQDLLGQIVNREAFSYDPDTDPLYGQYRKQYTREGQRATADALGTAAAASGGIASSYANTAAAQAGNYYAAQMTDKIPELYQLAYNKYLSDYNMKLSDLGAVQGAEQSDYDKFLNELQQYNTNRTFDYNTWLDEYNMINNNLQTASGLEQLEYTKFLNDLNQYNTDREFNYGVLLDEINSQTAERNEAMNKALTAAEYGDYSFLQDMGIDTSGNPSDWERQYTLALLAAEYGDFSGLQALGINPDAAGLASFNNTVNGKTGATGNPTGGNPTGTPTPTPTPTPTALSDADIQALTGYYGGTQLTDAQWNEILANNPSLTDAVLSDAGFTKKGEEEEKQEETGGGDLSAVKDYDSAIAYMKAAGVASSVRAGMMTRGEWTRRKASLQQFGTGGAEVKNYSSYADYVRDYVQYAASK